MRVLTTSSVLLCLGLAACSRVGLRHAAPLPAVLHPQVSQVAGEAYLQPRHNRERGPLGGPVLLEPGDWIETGAAGKVEVLLPGATVRLYRHTRVQVPFAFEDRKAVARELGVEAGEALIHVAGGERFTVRTNALEAEVGNQGATLLVGTRNGLHELACYHGRTEGRNVRVRGQTVIRMEPGHRLTLDDTATLALLRAAKLADEWRRWERSTVTSSGLVPPPSPIAPEPAPGSVPRPIVEQPLQEEPAQRQPPQ